jgi:hypothetical protein
MRPQDRRALISKYDAKIKQATSKALTGETADDLAAGLAEIDNYAKLLALPEHRWTVDAGVAVLFALLCLAVAGTLWTVKRNDNNVSLTLDTQNLQGQLAEPWSLRSEVSSQLVHIERASKLSSPNLDLAIDDPGGDAWVRLEGGTLSLESLELEEGAVLALASEDNQFGLFISGRPVRGTLAISGTGTLTAGTRAGKPSISHAYQTGNGPPETLDFAVRDPEHVPLHITIHAPQKWSLGRLRLQNLSFLVEETGNSPQSYFVSGVRSGVLTFNDTPGQPLTISEGDVFAIKDVRHAPVEIRSEKGIIHVSFSGVAGGITMGQGEARRQLAPSYLEYLYSKQKLSFFWGSAVGIWGVLWGIRKTIFR